MHVSVEPQGGGMHIHFSKAEQQQSAILNGQQANPSKADRAALKPEAAIRESESGKGFVTLDEIEISDAARDAIQQEDGPAKKNPAVEAEQAPSASLAEDPTPSSLKSPEISAAAASRSSAEPSATTSAEALPVAGAVDPEPTGPIGSDKSLESTPLPARKGPKALDAKSAELRLQKPEPPELPKQEETETVFEREASQTRPEHAPIQEEKLRPGKDAGETLEIARRVFRKALAPKPDQEPNVELAQMAFSQIHKELGRGVDGWQTEEEGPGQLA
jgi:hypothetical protein